MKYFIVLAVFLLVLAGFRWCLLPHGRLPRFRVRHMRIRLRLRLHPGRGHATVGELWLRWGRFAAFRRSGRSRRSLPAWQRMRHPALYSPAPGPGAVPARAAGPGRGARPDHGAAADRARRACWQG